MKIDSFTIINLFLLVVLFPADAETIRLRVLQTTDIHSYFDSCDNPKEGGWLRIASMIKKHRQQDDCLLIDCGDTIQGSLSAIASRGEAAVDMINHLKYDFWVPGNHELDFGISRYLQLLNKIRVPVLNGNFRITGSSPKKFDCWKIVEKKGLRVCVIGMQASYLNHWFKGSDFENYKVEKAYEVLLREMPLILKQQPQLIILALHQGFRFSDKRGVNEISQISRRFPEIDLILGGHTHQPHAGRNLSGTWYSQAAFHASHLGVIDLFVDKLGKQRVQVKSGLEKATADIPKDEDASQIYEKWRQQISRFKNDILVKLPQPLTSRGVPGKGSGTAAAVGEALRKTAGADLAIHGKFTSAEIPEEVTAASLFKVIPYENYIFRLTVTRAQLRKIIEEQLMYIKSGSFNGPAGFQIYLDDEKKLDRISFPDEKKAYTLAVNSRVAAGGGGRFPWLKQEIDSGRIKSEEVKVNTRQALRIFLVKAGQNFKVPVNVFYR